MTPIPGQPARIPIIGFVAGTPILTATGSVPIDRLRPGDLIQMQPDDDQGDDKPEAHVDTENDYRWWERN